MNKQFLLLAQLEGRAMFGFNVWRNTRDRAEKRRRTILGASALFAVLVFAGYFALFACGLCALGEGRLVPLLLVLASSMAALLPGLLGAGNLLFKREGYDMLVSLPLKTSAIVQARLLRLYAESLALNAVLLLPGLAVYAGFLRPGIVFYLCAVLAFLFSPLLPAALACALGTGVAALSSRMRHKSLVQTALTLLLALALLGALSAFSVQAQSLSLNALRTALQSAADSAARIYPTGAWFGRAMAEENAALLLPAVFSSAAGFALALFLAVRYFHKICRALHASASLRGAKGEARAKSALASLTLREARRYFASSVYVTNTILGPIFALILSASTLFADMRGLLAGLALPVDAARLFPFVFTAVFCLMNPAACSISMEGKTFWQVKTLPLDAKAILGAKFLFSLLLALPFYLLSMLFLLLGLRPAAGEAAMLLLFPAFCTAFSLAFALWVNLRMPKLNWDSEMTVVKQSASAMLGGIGGTLAALLGAAGAALCPQALYPAYALALLLLFAALTALFLRAAGRADLSRIN